jgi:hypothetical protein
MRRLRLLARILLDLVLVAWAINLWWPLLYPPLRYHGPVHVVEPERIGRVG